MATTQNVYQPAEREPGNRNLIACQMAGVEVLKTISALPDNPQPAFELIVRRARELCDAQAVTVIEYDGALMRQRAVEGVDPKAAKQLSAIYPHLLEQETIAGSTNRRSQILHIRDLNADFGIPWPGCDPILRSMLSVPLLRESRVVGALLLGRIGAGGFDESAVVIAQSFAEQAAIAIGSAAALGELRTRTLELDARNSEYGERIEQQSAIIDVIKVMSRRPEDTQPVFDLIVRRARELCNSSGSRLMEFDGERVHLRSSCVEDSVSSRAFSALFPMAPTRGTVTCRAILEKKVIHIRDLDTDPDINPIVRGTPRKSQLAIPFLREGQAIGAIVIGSDEPGGYSESQIALLQTFAEQAVIAITSPANYRKLREQTVQLAQWNQTLEQRVADQLAVLKHLDWLKRFLAPQIAELVITSGDEILQSHRRNVAVLFCDLRGFTSFSEVAEPEEQIAMLAEYHTTLGALINRFQGTLIHIVGDGVMVVFNDPIPCSDPCLRAVQMAMEMRSCVSALMAQWQTHGYDLGFGIGISQGYATLGLIGFENRSQYTAIGTVTNLASRLCGEAADGQIFIDSKVKTILDACIDTVEVGDLMLKGLRRPIRVFNIVGLAEARS
jgi:class 3 adenylate cyclase/transcriptional regulator with GAF, ATPase, and Fis domain